MKAGGAPDGRNSPTVAGRLRMSCAGWTTIPSAREFHRAVHDPSGSDRETAILLTWYHEADTLEHAKAWLEGAYTWRALARALHRVRADPRRGGPKTEPLRRAMTGEKKPDLELRGQPAGILERMRPAFKTHVRPHTENREGERLGGGSILNARWNHRLSRDVDVHLRLTSKEDGRAILDRAARACDGYRVEHPNFPGSSSSATGTTTSTSPSIRRSRGGRTDGGGGRRGHSPVLSNAQIMTGKLKGRGMNGPGGTCSTSPCAAKRTPRRWKPRSTRSTT